jgi:hypothetical protein
MFAQPRQPDIGRGIWQWRRRRERNLPSAASRHLMRQPWNVIGWLPLVLLNARVACQTEGPTTVQPSALGPGPIRSALDRLLTQGDIQVAEARLKDFGFDPGPVDGTFTAQTQAAVRAFQARYGLTVSGLLDRATRRELLPGLDSERDF